MKKCVKCNAELENDAEFCGECGERQPVLKTAPTCPNCGNPIEEGAEFCPECGQKIIKTNSSSTSSNFSTENESSANKFSEITKKPAYLGGIGAAIVAVIAIAYFLFAGNVVEVKASDMLNDYIRDQSIAEQKYKGKNIKITGSLLYKYQFSNSSDWAMVVASQVVGDKRYSIILQIDSENTKAVNSINVGDFISAKGKGIGIVPQEDPTVISVQIHTDSINE